MKKIIMLLVINFVIIGLIGCSNVITVDSVEQAFDSGEYENVKTMYYELNDSEQDEVDSILYKKIADASSKWLYSDMDENEYKECLTLIENYKTLAFDGYEKKANDLKEMLENSYKYSLNIKVGKEAYNNKDYDKASSELNKVSEDAGAAYNRAQEIIKKIEEIKEKERLEEMEKNPPVEIVNVSLSRDIIDNQIAKVQFKNTSDYVIKEIKFVIFGYDKNGYPVKLYFNSDTALNAKQDQTLQPNEKSSSDVYWNLYTETTEVTQLKVIVNEVLFYDDIATWSNSKFSEEYAKYNGQPLK